MMMLETRQDQITFMGKLESTKYRPQNISGEIRISAEHDVIPT